MSLSDISLEAHIKKQDYLPLREPTFFILLSISSMKKHGDAILQDMEYLSRGVVKLTMWGAIGII